MLHLFVDLKTQVIQEILNIFKINCFNLLSVPNIPIKIYYRSISNDCNLQMAGFGVFYREIN